MKKRTDLYFSPSDAFNNASFSHISVYICCREGETWQIKSFKTAESLGQGWYTTWTISFHKILKIRLFLFRNRGQICVFLGGSQVLHPTQLFRINQNLPNQSEPELQASSVWRRLDGKLVLVLPSMSSKNVASHKELSLMTATGHPLPRQSDCKRTTERGHEGSSLKSLDNHSDRCPTETAQQESQAMRRRSLKITFAPLVEVFVKILSQSKWLTETEVLTSMTVAGEQTYYSFGLLKGNTSPY